LQTIPEVRTYCKTEPTCTNISESSKAATTKRTGYRWDHGKWRLVVPDRAGGNCRRVPLNLVEQSQHLYEMEFALVFVPIPKCVLEA